MRRLQSVKRAVARFEASPLTHFPAGHRSFAATDMNNIQMPGFSGSSTCSSLSILHDLTLLTNSPSFRDRYSHMAQARPQSGWLDLFWLPEPFLVQWTPCYRPIPRINHLSKVRAHHPPKASNRATALLLAVGTSISMTAHGYYLVCSSRLPLCRGQRATARSLGSMFFEEWLQMPSSPRV
jgi:hypothetical protein